MQLARNIRLHHVPPFLLRDFLSDKTSCNNRTVSPLPPTLRARHVRVQTSYHSDELRAPLNYGWTEGCVQYLTYFNKVNLAGAFACRYELVRRNKMTTCCAQCCSVSPHHWKLIACTIARTVHHVSRPYVKARLDKSLLPEWRVSRISGFVHPRRPRGGTWGEGGTGAGGETTAEGEGEGERRKRAPEGFGCTGNTAVKSEGSWYARHIS